MASEKYQAVHWVIKSEGLVVQTGFSAQSVLGTGPFRSFFWQNCKNFEYARVFTRARDAAPRLFRRFGTLVFFTNSTTPSILVMLKVTKLWSR